MPSGCNNAYSAQQLVYGTFNTTLEADKYNERGYDNATQSYTVSK